MATPVMMPNVGISVESCILTEWHVKVGDQVKVGDLLFSYETDKSTNDEESQVEGTVLAILKEEGDDVPTMVNVCVIGAEGEDISAFLSSDAAPAEEAAPEVKEEKVEVKAEEVVEVKTTATEGFIKASPRAKNLAEKLGADIRFAVPTGAEGRIVESDVRNLVENGPMSTKAAAGAFDGQAGGGLGGKFSVNDIGAAPAASEAVAPAAAVLPEYVDEKMPNIRKVIAKQMTLSLTTIPQLTHTIYFDATDMMDFRAKLKAGSETLGLGKISLNDMVMFAISRVLTNPEFKALNANLIDGDTMRYFNGVHLGIATDTERGLMVPTLFNADKMSLSEISEKSKELFAACKKGNISPDLLKGASFTISNVGAFGIESFTPVINPPQTGILGVDGIVTRVKEVNGELKAYKAMGLSLTYDHRALDGAPASKFLVAMKNALENFSILLSK